MREFNYTSDIVSIVLTYLLRCSQLKPNSKWLQEANQQERR